MYIKNNRKLQYVNKYMVFDGFFTIINVNNISNIVNFVSLVQSKTVYVNRLLSLLLQEVKMLTISMV